MRPPTWSPSLSALTWAGPDMPAGGTAADANSRGLELFNNYERTGNLQLLQEAITLFQKAVDATPAGHAYRPAYLTNLGTALKARFERTGQQPDLEAVGATRAGHPSRPGYLSNLANALGTRFRRTGRRADLDRIITLFREAIDGTPAGHPFRPRFQSDLDTALLIRRERFGH
jgi:tetratricopeptide (TPR) repeat protein